MKQPSKEREVIFEMVPLGSFVKMNAVDVMSMVEVSIQGPASASKEELKQVALKKLEYVLRKQGIIR